MHLASSGPSLLLLPIVVMIVVQVVVVVHCRCCGVW